MTGARMETAESARFGSKLSGRSGWHRLFGRSRDEMNAVDRAVIDSLESGTVMSRQPDDEPPARFGERAADAVAAFGGSWTFICLFLGVMAGWVLLNAGGVMAAPFDPYPFILLNLVLSCIAAVQAPVIMMSQRRQETKDRARALNDYQVNLKAELEIRQLHEKIDHQLALIEALLAERRQASVAVGERAP